MEQINHITNTDITIDNNDDNSSLTSPTSITPTLFSPTPFTLQQLQKNNYLLIPLTSNHFNQQQQQHVVNNKNDNYTLNNNNQLMTTTIEEEENQLNHYNENYNENHMINYKMNHVIVNNEMEEKEQNNLHKYYSWNKIVLFFAILLTLYGIIQFIILFFYKNLFLKNKINKLNLGISITLNVINCILILITGMIGIISTILNFKFFKHLFIKCFTKCFTKSFTKINFKKKLNFKNVKKITTIHIILLSILIFSQSLEILIYIFLILFNSKNKNNNGIIGFIGFYSNYLNLAKSAIIFISILCLIVMMTCFISCIGCQVYRFNLLKRILNLENNLNHHQEIQLEENDLKEITERMNEMKEREVVLKEEEEEDSNDRARDGDGSHYCKV
ncbi:hypothetical protein ABK040_016691 [Willaertia magna]